MIARRIRESDVYSEILPWDIDEDKIKDISPVGIILSGGPESVTQSFTPRIPQIVFDLDIPLLGICYGMQTLAEQMGGQVISSNHKEFGHAELNIESESKGIFDGIGDKLNVWMSHGDQVQDLPDNFKLIASTTNAPIAAMQHENKDIFALQFHPEVTHTNDGHVILNNFIFNVCSAKQDWKMDDLINQRIQEIKDQVKDQKVLLGLSGGVDSSVTAALLHQAIGKNLTCVFVDNGLLRKGEAEEVMTTFKENMSLNVIKSDSEEVLRHLKGVSDPEQKRKIIGRTFIDVFDAEATKLKDINFLAQGTIYPDVIESSGSESKEARVIKSHHNVGGLPDEMKMDLVEPLRDLFKDEVRKMGVELGLSAEMLNRHPFPGPGLGVRILVKFLSKNNCIKRGRLYFYQELIKADLYDKVSQAFAVYLPIKSVGVVGDERRYAEVIGLRAVETVDFAAAMGSITL